MLLHDEVMFILTGIVFFASFHITYLHEEDTFVLGCINKSFGVLCFASERLFTEHMFTCFKHHRDNLHVLGVNRTNIHDINLRGEKGNIRTSQWNSQGHCATYFHDSPHLNHAG